MEYMPLLLMVKKRNRNNWTANSRIVQSTFRLNVKNANLNTESKILLAVEPIWTT